MVNWKYLIIGAILLVLLGYGAGRYLQPAKVVTKTEVVVHDHIHTVTITISKPDGTKTTTTTTDNNSVIDDKTSTVITNSKPQWKVAGLAGLNISNLSSPIYGAQIERRIIGPISVGVWGLTNSSGGISLSLEF